MRYGIRWAGVVLAGLVMFLNGCDGGGSNDEPPANVVGSWDGHAASDGLPINLTFKADGTYTASIPLGTDTGTYAVSGSSVGFTSTGVQGRPIVTLNGVSTQILGNTMTGSIVGPGTFTLTRQSS